MSLPGPRVRSQVYLRGGRKIVVWRDRLCNVLAVPGRAFLWFALDRADNDLIVAGVDTKAECLRVVGIEEW